MYIKNKRTKYLEDYQPDIDIATGKLVQTYIGAYYSWNLSDEDNKKRRIRYLLIPLAICVLSVIPGCFFSELSYFWIIEFLYAVVCVMAFAEFGVILSFNSTSTNIKRKTYERMIPGGEYLCLVLAVTALIVAVLCVTFLFKYPIIIADQSISVIYPISESASGILGLWFWRLQRYYRKNISIRS